MELTASTTSATQVEADGFKTPKAKRARTSSVSSSTSSVSNLSFSPTPQSRGPYELFVSQQ